MKSIIPLLGLSILSACGDGSIVSNVAAPPDAVVGDASGQGLSDPANGAARERNRKAAIPAPTDGMGWHWNATTRGAHYGPSADITMLGIDCEGGRIVVRRFDAAPQGARATISFTGNGTAASLPAASVGDSAKLTSLWQSTTPAPDTIAAVARVFDGPTPVEIALPGTTTLVVRPSPLPGRAIAACRS